MRYFGTGRADYCIVTDDNGKVIGAVWTRIMNDYGHVDDDTPSFAISLYKENILWCVNYEANYSDRQWDINFPETELPQIYKLLEQYGAGKEIHIFKEREDANSKKNGLRYC